MNELAKLLREASEGRWITTRAGNRVFIGGTQSKTKARSIQDIVGIKKVFDEKDTGVPWYNNILENPEYMKNNKGVEGKIEYMSPDQYLERIGQDIHTKPIASGSRTQVPMTLHDELQTINSEVAIEYADMTKKSPMPLPYIDYVDKSQEGRHRAYAAKILGVEKMPVLIVTKVK